MYFIHSADWHIGDSWKILPQDYLKRQSLMIDNIYLEAYQRKIRTVVVCGDLFHKKDPNRESRDLVLSKLLKYDKYFRTIIMEGNHDSVEAKASNIHFLKILYNKKRFKNTIIVELENKIVPVEDGAFLVMPKFNEDELEKLVKQISSKYKWLVAMLHTTTVGVSSDTNWKAQKGWDMKPIPHITYYALGHIHKYQRLTLPNAFQCGSPIQHKWSDKQPKGILIVDTNNPEQPELITLKKVKPLYTITDSKKVPKDGYVRLITNKCLLGEKLPSNIVSTEKDLSNVEISEYDGELDPINGLPEFLANEGLNSEEQQIGIDLVEKIINNIK